MRRERDERGSMAVEIVLLTPVLICFILLIVACGRYVSVQGEVQSAARDAARAASFETDYGSAQAAALQAANAVKDAATCTSAQLSGTNFVAGGMVRVEIVCKVSYSGLGLLGVPGEVTVKATSSAPIDTYQEVQ